MNLDECLNRELATLAALADLAAPRIADRRPWYARWVAALSGVLL